MKPVLLAVLTVLSLPLAACGERPDAMPQTAAEANQRQIAIAPDTTGAATQSEIAQSVIQAEYACANGERLTVAFDNARSMATIHTLDGLAVDLRQVRSADGFWYRSDRHSLRGVGDSATWTVTGREPTTCSAVG